MVRDLTDIDFDALEKQLGMAFGNLVKKRSKVKLSILTPQRKKELAKPKDNELNAWNGLPSWRQHPVRGFHTPP